MLSKFYEIIDNNYVKADTEYVSALIRKLNRLETLTNVGELSPGGTLGLFLSCEIDGEKCFLKSHHPNEKAADNLSKELKILSVLYKDLLNIREYSVCVDKYESHVMAMKYLDKQKETHSVQYIKALIADYSGILSSNSVTQINYTISDFERAVDYSSVILAKENLIDVLTKHRIEQAIRNLKSYAECTQIICHGDLSDANIFTLGERAVALDWEDAMINVKDYDLLYWLTFFSQRRLYSSSLFSDIGIKETYAKDIMIMIIAVKSYLSFANGSYLKNKLSIQDRFNEIIRM